MQNNSPFIVYLADIAAAAGGIFSYQKVLPISEEISLDLVEIPAGTPLEIDLQLQLISEGVLVQGSIKVEARGKCARCLDPLQIFLDERVSEVIFTPEEIARLLAEGDSEAQDFPAIQDGQVDLEPLLHDVVVLALPLRPLCRRDCPGLCPGCGEKWDDLPDSHHHEVLDPRFAVLEELRAQLQAEEAKETDSEDNA
ncbi:YceD family protein [Arcanobacterium urinimassiliense]|uniref:YceD family protein n=1 Tax=Arcanobacterium urinimassiliense TaxID=1871014 RepID=UPI00093D3369|nr:YceD family protein [Arcanobacterium urinimassiliense]